MISNCLFCPVCLVRGEALSLLSFLNVASNQILSYWTIIFDNLDLSINANKQKMMTFISSLSNDGIFEKYIFDYLTWNQMSQFLNPWSKINRLKIFLHDLIREINFRWRMSCSSHEPRSWWARVCVTSCTTIYCNNHCQDPDGKGLLILFLYFLEFK